MWRTVKGVRTLGPAEGTLFKHAFEYFLEDLLEVLKSPSAECTGNQFHRLSPAQRAVVAAEVLIALLDPAVPPPGLTAVNEAAISAVFDFLEIPLQIDIDDLTGPVKNLIAAALAERQLGVPEQAEDDEPWFNAIEELKDEILWDRDFEDESPYMDRPPEQAAFTYQCMRVDPDYFQSLVPEPTKAELEQSIATLRQILEHDSL